MSSSYVLAVFGGLVVVALGMVLAVWWAHTPTPAWWERRKARRRCPHSDLSPIYGDAINQAGGYRLWCRGCKRLIDGPVTLAEARKHEGTPE